MTDQKTPPSYALPALDDLIRPWPAPGWFPPFYQRLARHVSPYRRLVAIGLVINRFLPDPEYLEAFLDKNGMGEISDRVHIWVCQQEPAMMKEVSRLAEQELLEISSELSLLSRNKWPEQELVTLAIRREFLEAVKAILLIHGYAIRLLDGLRALDAWADANIPFDNLRRQIPSDLLVLVRETGGKQWWGRVTSD